MKDGALGVAQARVGPNAILQCAPALAALGGEDLTRRIYADAGLSRMLDMPPENMVPQDEVVALHRAIADGLPPDQAAQVARDAGARTGRYIVENRIPAPARLMLRALPARLSGPTLLRAITRHAWTFAGDADVLHDPGPDMRLAILDNPLAIGPCHWHEAVLQTMFRRLVSRRAQVRETRCCARGAPACIFEIAM
jgi:divinyl protochlorophyllide a 8-vinyl-reductase